MWATLGHEAGASYFAGYVIEKSLSVDNLFVFALLFQFFVGTRSSSSTGCCSGA